MKKTLLLLFCALSMLSGCSQVNAYTTDLNLSATGEIVVVPDIAEFSVSVKCVDKDIGEANTCAKGNLDRVFDVLKKHQIYSSDFQSSGIRLDKEYFWKENTQTFRGFRLSVSVTVLVRNLDNVGPLLTELMDEEALNVSPLTYSHSELKAFQRQANLKALDNATLLAEEFMEKLGGTSIEIVEITNGTPLARPEVNTRVFTAANASMKDTVAVNVGTIKIEKHINAHFRIIR